MVAKGLGRSSGISPHVCVTPAMSVTPGSWRWGAAGHGPPGTQDASPPTSCICSGGSHRPEEALLSVGAVPGAHVLGQLCFW